MNVSDVVKEESKMTATMDVRISDRELADFLRKAIKGLAKGTLTLENCELTEGGIRLIYHRTPKRANHN